MSCSDENRPVVANVYHSKGEELASYPGQQKKASELIKSSRAETATSVPKPVATTAGKDVCKGWKEVTE